jgi:hypothetical protein
MEKNYPNKSITNEDISEPTEKLVEFNFPQHGITVKAANLEEAQAKLKQLINK